MPEPTYILSFTGSKAIANGLDTPLIVSTVISHGGGVGGSPKHASNIPNDARMSRLISSTIASISMPAIIAASLRLLLYLMH